MSELDRRDKILSGIYYRGQEKIWDGRTVLKELVDKHGGPAELDPEKRQALNRIFTMILRGEEAAWKISLQLASMLEDVPARMAATSQSHDEARHFYVMKDYLELAGCEEVDVPPTVMKVLNTVMGTDSLAKKLLGMQLMVEPVALTIFQKIREADVDPMLSELLTYYERDEARHVALGVQHLPHIIRQKNPFTVISLMGWQTHMFMLELRGLRDLKPDFETLGLDVHDMFALAEKKQVAALTEVSEQLGWGADIWRPLQYLLKYQKNRLLG